MLNIQKIQTSTLLALLSSSLLLAGCGRGDGLAIGEVAGTVTLDSQPLAGAMVTFVPTNNAKESYGYTDENGRYELLYKLDIKGAIVGQYHVRITTATEQKPKERLPTRYHRQTELTAVVENGANKINFDLVSKSN